MALSERMYQVLKYAATSKNGVCPLTGQAGEANQTSVQTRQNLNFKAQEYPVETRSHKLPRQLKCKRGDEGKGREVVPST